MDKIVYRECVDITAWPSSEGGGSLYLISWSLQGVWNITTKIYILTIKNEKEKNREEKHVKNEGKHTKEREKTHIKKGQCNEIFDHFFVLRQIFDLGPIWTGKNGFANYFVFSKIFEKNVCPRSLYFTLE